MGGPRQRLRPLLLGGVVAALLAVGLVLGQDDSPTPPSAEGRDGAPSTSDRSTTTTARPRATTTSTTEVPVPLLPGSGVQLVVSGRPGRAHLIDLDTGVTSDIELGTFAEVFDLLPVRGGVVAMLSGGVTYLPLPSGEPVPLGEANQVLPGGPAAVWLVRGDDPYELTGRAQLVDLRGNALTGLVQPPSGWIVGTWARGLIVQAGGRIYAVDLAGEVTPLATGEVLGVSEGWILARTCDEEATCGLVVWDADRRREQEVRTTPEDRLGYFGASVVVEPGGDRAALLSYGPEGTTLSIVDLSGGPPITVDEIGELSDVAWLPGDLGLVAARSGELLRVRLDDGRAVVEVLRDRGAEFVAVIPR